MSSKKNCWQIDWCSLIFYHFAEKTYRLKFQRNTNCTCTLIGSFVHFLAIEKSQSVEKIPFRCQWLWWMMSKTSYIRIFFFSFSCNMCPFHWDCEHMLMRREKNIIFHLGKLRSYSKCDNDNITHIYKLDKNTAIAMHRLRLSNTPEIRT